MTLVNNISNPLIPFLFPLVLFLLFWVIFYFAFPRLWLGMKFSAQRISVLVVRSGLKKWSDAHPKLSVVLLYLPMILILVGGGFAAFAAGKLFGDLSQSFRLTDSGIFHIDQIVNVWFRTERFHGLTILFIAVTDLGGPIGMGVIAIVLTVLLVRKERASAIYMVITGIGGVLLNVGLKLLYARARPDVATSIAVAQGNSFPSGHAMGSFIILGAIAYLMLRQNFTWKLKSVLLAVIVTLIVLVGLSRVYLGVHWSSDIIAGWCAGTVWLAAATVAFETLLRIRHIKRGASPMGAGADVPDKPIPPSEPKTANISTQAKKVTK
jgi:membrane-associated phospholipid phosphatase